MYDQVLLDQAMEVKRTVVGMMLNGVISSSKDVTDALDSNSGEVMSINKLLEYSDLTRKHLKVERLTLSMLPKNPTVSEDYDHLHSSGADIVYNGNGGDFFNMGHYVKYNFLFYSQEEAYTSISINRLLKWSEKFWEVKYGCVVHDSNERHKSPWTGSMVYPERDMLLNFLFSPIQLTHVQIMNYMGGSENFKKYTHFSGAYKWNGFKHIQFLYEGDKLGRIYARLKDHPNSMREGKALVERGDFRFSIIELGTAMIGGVKHWIYTGSERIESIIQ